MNDSSPMVKDIESEQKNKKNKYSLRNDILSSLTNIKPDEINHDMIKCMDFNKDENMYLFSYGTGSKDLPEIVKNCRGRVYDKDGKLIMSCFNYVDELTPSEFKESYPDFDVSSYDCFLSREGTVIRLFYYNDKWHISTHKRLDAYKSKWSSKKSFGKLFEDDILNFYSSMDDFFSVLDKNSTYAFLILSTPENRIVSRQSIHGVYHVSTLKNGQFINCDIGIKKFDQLSSDMSLDDIFKMVEGTDPYEAQGVILFHKNLNYQVKIVNERYQYLSSLRGNEPSIKFRYIHVRMDPQMKTDFVELYKEHEQWFELYERIINETIHDIFNAYITRFVNNDYIMIPQKEFIVLNKCKIHIASQSENYKLTLDDVTRFFNELNYTFINKIIKDRYFSYTPKEYYKTPGRNFFFNARK